MLVAFCLHCWDPLQPGLIDFLQVLQPRGRSLSPNGLLITCFSVSCWSRGADSATVANLDGKSTGQQRKGQREVIQLLRMQLLTAGLAGPVRSQADPGRHSQGTHRPRCIERTVQEACVQILTRPLSQVGKL